MGRESEVGESTAIFVLSLSVKGKLNMQARG